MTSAGGTVTLPAADLPAVSLAAALDARSSCRAFAAAPASLSALATLLHAGYGVRGWTRYGGITLPERPVPSAGGVFPLTLRVMVRAVEELAAGAYRYESERHELQPAGSGGDPVSLFYGQPWLATAAAVIVIGARPEVTARRYGARTWRYVYFEAGHVAQNINLTAAALGVGSLNLGGFHDAALAQAVGSGADEVPLYGVAVGVRETADRHGARRLPTA